MKINLVLPRLKFLADPLRNAPLGALYVAAALKQAGAEVVITDQRADERIIPEAADAYAWTATTLEYPEAIRSAFEVAKRFPKAMRILGGVHASVVPESEIDLVFDLAVPGEGEPIAKKLVRAIEECHFWTFWIQDLPPPIDETPWPARELLPRDHWISHSLVDAGVPATTIIASRGCPYHCAFCAAPTLYGRRVRWRAIDKIAEEIHYLKEEHGVAGLRFHDDCFGVDRQRFYSMCQMLGGMDIIYRVNMRATAMDQESASLLLKSGCTEVGIGVESAHQPSLDAVEKGLSVEAAAEAIAACKAVGLRVRAFMMIGLPHEGHDIGDKTIAFLDRTRPDRVVLSSFVPFPGSHIHEHAEEYGLRYTDPNISAHRMFVGPDDNEPFRFGYADMPASELEMHRSRILRWLRQEGMA